MPWKGNNSEHRDCGVVLVSPSENGSSFSFRCALDVVIRDDRPSWLMEWSTTLPCWLVENDNWSWRADMTSDSVGCCVDGWSHFLCFLEVFIPFGWLVQTVAPCQNFSVLLGAWEGHPLPHHPFLQNYWPKSSWGVLAFNTLKAWLHSWCSRIQGCWLAREGRPKCCWFLGVCRLGCCHTLGMQWSLWVHRTGRHLVL